MQGDAFDCVAIYGISGNFFGAVAKEGQSVIKIAARDGGKVTALAVVESGSVGRLADGGDGGRATA